MFVTKRGFAIGPLGPNVKRPVPEPKAAVAKTSAAVKPVPKEEAPIKKLLDSSEINAHFDGYILDQCVSITRLSICLASIHTRRQYAKDKDEPYTYTISLAGPSGTGKSLTIARMLHLLGMSQGQEYENQVISYDPAQMNIVGTDQEDINRRLAIALGYSECMQTVPSSYIVLYIHNFTEMSESFRRAMTQIINGSYTKKLPPRTTLLVIFTTHIGSDEISAMERRNDDEAMMIIQRKMPSALSYSIVNAIQLSLPYYPLSLDTLRLLLNKRLEEYLENSDVVKQFGAQGLEADPRMRRIFIGQVIQIMGKDGINCGAKVLTDKLTQLFDAGVRALNAMKKKPLSDTIHLESTSIQTKSLLERGMDPVMNEFLRVINENPVNKLTYNDSMLERDGVLSTVSMRYGAEAPICSLVMNVTHVTIINNNNTYIDVTHEVKRQNETLKDCLREINSAVEGRDDDDVVHTIINKHRSLFDDGKSLKRKALTQATDKERKARVEEIAIKAKEPTLLESMGIDLNADEFSVSDDDPFSGIEEKFEDMLSSGDEYHYVPPVPKKKGRPAEKIKGFKRIDSEHGRASWICKKCHKGFSKTIYIKKHTCKHNKLPI